MKDILGWTTKEQSKQLIAAGIVPKTHDMHYFLSSGIYQLRCTNHPAVAMNLFSYRNDFVIPIWSLGRLIELMESFEGTKVSYDDGSWTVKQGDICCVGECLPEVCIECLNKRKNN